MVLCGLLFADYRTKGVDEIGTMDGYVDSKSS